MILYENIADWIDGALRERGGFYYGPVVGVWAGGREQITPLTGREEAMLLRLRARSLDG